VTERTVVATAEGAATAERPERAAMFATYVAFVAAGFVFANWAARIPQVRARLHLSSGELGLLLLAIAVGSLMALPSAGVIVHRFGSRRTVTVMAGVAAVGMIVVAFGYLAGPVPVGIGLLLFGFASGAWDVAMNVQGATVERRLGKSIMPRFHAGFSVGTVAGALLGAVMVAAGVPVTGHLLGVSIAVAIAVPLAVRSFLADVEDDAPHEPGRAALRRWLEPRTIAVGLIVLAFTLCEGTANDWINVSLIGDYGTQAVVGTLGLATFLAAMTAARWFGTTVLDRYGRVTVVRVLAFVVAAGIALFAFSPVVPLAFVGALLWGVGASLGFPVGMSAAADEPAAAPGRVSVVASLGYCAFLAGPPFIGFLGEQLTVRHALVTIGVIVLATVLLARWLRPIGPSTSQPQ
jgi:MFS family permease